MASKSVAADQMIQPTEKSDIQKLNLSKLRSIKPPASYLSPNKMSKHKSTRSFKEPASELD